MGAASYSLSAHRRDTPGHRGLHVSGITLDHLHEHVAWALKNGCDTIIINLHTADG